MESSPFSWKVKGETQQFVSVFHDISQIYFFPIEHKKNYNLNNGFKFY